MRGRKVMITIGWIEVDYDSQRLGKNMIGKLTDEELSTRGCEKLFIIQRKENLPEMFGDIGDGISEHLQHLHEIALIQNR